jgi:hypothetical protein
MTPICNLTYKIVAFSEVPCFNADECVDWAMEMISLGHESEHILILAGLTKPVNFFETTDYLRSALKELGLAPKAELDGKKCYCHYLVAQIARGIKVSENMSAIVEYCYLAEDECHVLDFNLLDWARCDLEFGNTHQEYWPGATTNTVGEIAIQIAQKWLKENSVSL